MKNVKYRLINKSVMFMKENSGLKPIYLAILKIGLNSVLILLAISLVLFLKFDFSSPEYIFGERLCLAALKIAVLTAVFSFGADSAERITCRKSK